MEIIKIFTEMDAIISALELISEYPLGERPRVYVRYEQNARNIRDWVQGTLIKVSNSKRMIIIREICIGLKYIFTDRIRQLAVYDEKEEEWR